MMITQPSTLELVRAELLKVAMPGVTSESIAAECLLVDDLGIDSMHFVDLALALERALGIAEFPMQRWVDDCVERQQPITVGALVAMCNELRATVS